MFETIASSEVPIPKELGCANYRMWPFVTRGLCAPLFFATYSLKSESHVRVRQILMDHIQIVRDILSEFYVREMYVLVPGYFNERPDWTMHRVLELRSGVEPDSGASAMMCRYTSNAHMAFTEFGPAQAYQDLELLFLDSVREGNGQAK